MRLNHPNCAHRLERDTARQEAAAARTEALQLRGEREVALNRLRAALDASNTQQRESGRQVLAVQLEREIATSRMRADRDAAMKQVQLLEQRVAEAVAEREAAWAHGKTDRDLLERALRHRRASKKRKRQMADPPGAPRPAAGCDGWPPATRSSGCPRR